MDDLALETVLAKIYPDPGSLNRILMGAGVDVSRVEQSDRAIVAWHNALTEATAQGRILGVIQIAQSEYPNHAELTDAAQAWRQRTYIPIAPGEIAIRLGHTIQRIEKLEHDVKRIWRVIDPNVRRRVSVAIAFVLLVVWWTALVNLLDWYLENPVAAIFINGAFLAAAGLVYWLGSDEAQS